MRRGPLLVLGMIVVAGALVALAAKLRGTRGQRSVVLVTIDTLRADHVGAYGAGGGASPTPRIDALALEGLLFEQAWTTAPLTVPAHATLLTGRLPPAHGLRTNRPRVAVPPRAERTWATMAEAFRGAGRRTGAFVSASVLRADRTGLGAGFDRYDDVDRAAPGSLVENERRGDATVAAALAWVAESEAPFFLWVHLFDPHAPYDAPQPFGAGSAHSADATGYAGEVAWADHCVGTLLDGILAAGHADAVVAVTSDHGEGLGEHGEATHGYLLHEATLRVPLVLSVPGSGLSGRRFAHPVTLRDVAPTLLRFAGDLPVPEGMATASLLDAGGAAALYAESLYGHEAFRWAQCFALRAGDEKLVDAGPEVLETDLAADPAENASRRHDAASPPTPLAERLAALAAVARTPLAGVGAATPDSSSSAMEGGSYWGGGPAGGTVLPAEENRRLPSPYERIGLVVRLDAAKARASSGDGAAALADLDALAALDPANPEISFWRGRALQSLSRFGDAAAAFRSAADLGRLDADTVAKFLQASLQTQDASAVDAAVSFLEKARGRGLRDDGATFALEANLRLLRGERDAAEEALARARRMPSTPAVAKLIEGTESALRAARGTGPEGPR